MTEKVYGSDRASFNQGKNAQFDFTVLENTQPTLTARGPGAVCAIDYRGGHTVAGAICERDSRGICNQWMSEAKIVLEVYE